MLTIQKLNDFGVPVEIVLNRPPLDLTGLLGLILVVAILLIVSSRHKSIGLALVVALIVRCASVLFHEYIMPLPDSTGDALSFEAMAWDYTVHGPYTGSQTVPGHHILGSCAYTGLIRDQCSFSMHYPGPNSDFYPWLMSLVYLVTGRSFLLLQSISVFVGVLSVYATWLLGSEVWNDRAGRRAAWVMALYPTVVMYSALPLREAYLTCILMFALVWVARWSREGKVRQAIWAFLLFGVGTFFHGAIFLVAFAFLVVIASKILLRGGQSIIRGRLRLTALIGLIVIGGGLLYWGLSGAYVDKLGRLTDIFDLQRWVSYSQAKYYADGHASNAVYPGWTAPETVGDLVWAIPVKIIYLLFSPFPWDMRTPAHLIGVIDGLLYLGLIIIITRNIKTIWLNPAARTVLLVILPFIFAYAIGTSNFGTSIRHRAKFVGVLIMLSSFWFARLVIRRKPIDSEENKTGQNQNITNGISNN